MTRLTSLHSESLYESVYAMLCYLLFSASQLFSKSMGKMMQRSSLHIGMAMYVYMYIAAMDLHAKSCKYAKIVQLHSIV